MKVKKKLYFDSRIVIEHLLSTNNDLDICKNKQLCILVWRVCIHKKWNVSTKNKANSVLCWYYCFRSIFVCKKHLFLSIQDNPVFYYDDLKHRILMMNSSRK